MKQLIKEYYSLDQCYLTKEDIPWMETDINFDCNEEFSRPFIINGEECQPLVGVFCGEWGTFHGDFWDEFDDALVNDYGFDKEQLQDFHNNVTDYAIQGRIWVAKQLQGYAFPYEALISTWGGDFDKDAFYEVCKQSKVDPHKTVYAFADEIALIDDWDSNIGWSDEIIAQNDKEKAKHMLPPEEKWRATADFRDTIAHKNADKLGKMTMAQYHNLIYQEGKESLQEYATPDFIDLPVVHARWRDGAYPFIETNEGIVYGNEGDKHSDMKNRIIAKLADTTVYIVNDIEDGDYEYYEDGKNEGDGYEVSVVCYYINQSEDKHNLMISIQLYYKDNTKSNQQRFPFNEKNVYDYLDDCGVHDSIIKELAAQIMNKEYNSRVYGGGYWLDVDEEAEYDGEPYYEVDGEELTEDEFNDIDYWINGDGAYELNDYVWNFGRIWPNYGDNGESYASLWLNNRFDEDGEYYEGNDGSGQFKVDNDSGEWSGDYVPSKLSTSTINTLENVFNHFGCDLNKSYVCIGENILSILKLLNGESTITITLDMLERDKEEQANHLLPPELKWKNTEAFRDTVNKNIGKKLAMHDAEGNFKGEMPMAQYHNLIYQEDKQHHPEAEDGDEYKIGFDGCGNADDFGHIVENNHKKIYISEDKLPLLQENITDIVYHFTYIDRLKEILSTNSFRFSSLENCYTPQREGYEYYMSTTRSIRGDSGFPLMCYQNEDKVRFTLDGRLLNQNPTVYCKAFDFFAPDDKESTSKQDLTEPSGMGFESHRDYKMAEVESEDRIFSKNRRLENANKYILRIDIFPNHNNEKITSGMKIRLEGLGLADKTYVYQEQQDFDAQTKNCTRIDRLQLDENVEYEYFSGDEGTVNGKNFYYTDDNAFPFCYLTDKEKLIIGEKGTMHINTLSRALYGIDTVWEIPEQHMNIIFSRLRGWNTVLGRVWITKGKDDYDAILVFWPNNEIDWNYNDDGIPISVKPSNSLQNKTIGIKVCEKFHLNPENVMIAQYSKDSTNDRLYPLTENTEIEVAPEEVDTSSFEVQDELQPEIWRNRELNPKLRLKLLDIADDFYNSLDIPWVKPKDIILTGSICNFNWSKFSDIDLHIVVDFSEVSEKTDFVKTFFDSKKNEWNDTHKDLEMFGFPVEVYVQDVTEDAVSSGVYSLDQNAWIKEPDANEMQDLSETDELKLKMAASSIMTLIDDIEAEYNSTTDKHQLEVINDKIDHLCKRLKELRTNGLDKNGEMSISNLVYKLLRRTDYLNKVWKISDEIYDKVNSINEGKTLTEGFRMFKYQDKIRDLSQEMMRLYQSIRNYGAGEWDEDFDAYYQNTFFRLIDGTKPIEVRVYYDENDNTYFDGYFDEKYTGKYNQIKGLICLFFNDDMADANSILYACQGFLTHELTHYLDDIRDKEKGLTKNNNYLDCPEDDNWLGWMCYVLLNETEWNAWQEEAMVNKAEGKDNIETLEGYLDFLKRVDLTKKGEKSQNLINYIKEIVGYVFQKNYDTIPIDIVRNKLVKTLEKRLNGFKQHLQRKENQIKDISAKQKDEARMFNSLGEKFIDLALGDGATKVEESNYGDVRKCYGVIDVNGKKYNILATKEAGYESYSWDFTDFNGVGFSISDSSFYEGMYREELSDVDLENVGKRAYEVLKKINAE